MATETIETPLTKLLGIKYPILLAGMGQIASPKLTAAVTNAGGLGCIGGVNFTPEILKIQIRAIKKHLIDKNGPFGVDLLIPKIGGGARKTNYDYTKGKLNKLVDIMIEEGVKLFVCAIGVAPKKMVDKLHNAGILYMNMVGAPKHVKYALEAGADIICCQGGEGGGHTGEIATTCLLPKCVDLVKGHKSPLTGQPIYCVGAGGIFDGRGVAMALAYGAQAVWVGTRFVNSIESGASKKHQKIIIDSTCHDTIRTEIYTGRPLRLAKHDYAVDWEENRKAEMNKLLKKGVFPWIHDKKPPRIILDNMLLMGQCIGNIDDVKSAQEIIHAMMNQCVQIFKHNSTRIKLVSML